MIDYNIGYIPTNLEEQIYIAQNQEMSYRTLHKFAKIHNQETDENIIIPYADIFSKYKEFFKDEIIVIKFEPDMFTLYKYNPKRLSNDLYDTPELWFELLRLNHKSSVVEFTNPLVSLYRPNNLRSIINEILILEEINGQTDAEADY